MLPLTPQLLVSTAIALAAWQHQTKAKDAEHDRGSPDATRRVSSLRFVQFVGFWSQFIYESGSSSWPLTGSQTMDGMTQFAVRHGVLASQPCPGDVFLLGAVRGKGHVLAGVVADVESAGTLLNGSPEFVCTTIEGEIRAAGSGNNTPRIISGLVRRRLSPAYGDRFIRWYELPAQAAPAAIVREIPARLITFDRARLRRAA
jgi:hypothetical protein